MGKQDEDVDVADVIAWLETGRNNPWTPSYIASDCELRSFASASDEQVEDEYQRLMYECYELQRYASKTISNYFVYGTAIEEAVKSCYYLLTAQKYLITFEARWAECNFIADKVQVLTEFSHALKEIKILSDDYSIAANRANLLADALLMKNWHLINENK